MSKKISIVIPAYNEAEVIDELYSQLTAFFEGHPAYQFEVIVVENGSADKTYQKLCHIREKDGRFKIIRLSRNFGCDSAVSAGLQYAEGDAAVIMNADLQDPPATISEFIKKWEEGYEIVYGIIAKRARRSFLRRTAYKIYYRLINKLTGGLLPKDVSDFRLIDRKVYKAVNRLPESNRFLRGMIVWTGFRQTGVPFNRQERFAGDSKANLSTVFSVAFNGIFSFSYIPLRIATVIGFLMSFASFVLILVFIAQFFIFGREVPGLLSTWTLISFLFGVLFLILGVIGEYIGRIYDEVKSRPNYIIREIQGFDASRHQTIR